MKVSEIKKTIEAEFKAFTPNPMMEKATAYIMTLDNAAFWTKEAGPYIGNAIGLVMELAGTGILIEGATGDKVAKMSQETGEITVATRGI